MKVKFSREENIIKPCDLEDFDFQLDPYIGCEHGCSYCYTQNHTDLNWESEIEIYEKLEEILSKEFSSIEPQKIYMGMETDPYQPLEEEYEQTRKVLEVLNELGFSVSILTKSDLVVRDIDLLKKMGDASVGTSIAFQDDDQKKLFEKCTSPNKDRYRALAKFKEEDIDTYALICPVIPFITDTKALINEVQPFVDRIWIYPLEIKSTEDKNWEKVHSIIDEHFPEILTDLEKIVLSTDSPYWERLSARLEKESKDLKIDL